MVLPRIVVLFLLSSVAFAGAAYSQGGDLVEIRQLIPPDGADGDSFGSWVSISGDFAVVGAFLDDDDGESSGSAYIFERGNGGMEAWGMVTKLTASDPAAGARFGESVAISGDHVVIGSPLADGTGAAYVFRRDQGGVDNWGEVTKLVAFDAAGTDLFGNRVAISGESLVIGARGDDDGGNSSGSAYVFERNQGGADIWGLVRKLVASDAAANDFFAFSTAIDVDTIAIGAVGVDGACPLDPLCDSGAVYLFERNQGGPDNWGQRRKILAADGEAIDQFGFAVAVSGTTLVVGATQDGDGALNAGSAYVFERDLGGVGTWGQRRKLIASDASISDLFGRSVAISGNLLAVGGLSDDACAGDTGCNSGAAYVFERNAGGVDGWGEVRKLTASDAQASDFFADSLAISGDILIAGARFDELVCPADPVCNSGSAYIFSPPPAGPTLTIPSAIPAITDRPVIVPFTFDSQGHDIAAMTFSVDFDESCLDFDPADTDLDGVPDAIAFSIPGAFSPTVTYAGADTTGELDFTIADFGLPFSSLPDGLIANLTLTPICLPIGTNTLAPVAFGATPGLSFGNTLGHSVAGSAISGSVEILAGLPGDCNADGDVDAGDLTACVLEVFDGDGAVWTDVALGTFSGNPVGCDANQDLLVDAGDFACKVLLIFGGQGACEPPSPTLLRGGGEGPRLRLGQAYGASGDDVTLSLAFSGQEHEIAAGAFSLDYDQSCLSFDPSDGDGDGLPDALSLRLPPGMVASAGFDPEDSDGELDMAFLDPSRSGNVLENGLIGTVRFTTLCDPDPAGPSAAVRFATEPALSLGSTLGQSVMGDSEDGLVFLRSVIFLDHFESGDTEAWSSHTP